MHRTQNTIDISDILKRYKTCDTTDNQIVFHKLLMLNTENNMFMSVQLQTNVKHYVKVHMKTIENEIKIKIKYTTHLVMCRNDVNFKLKYKLCTMHTHLTDYLKNYNLLIIGKQIA